MYIPYQVSRLIGTVSIDGTENFFFCVDLLKAERKKNEKTKY